MFQVRRAAERGHLDHGWLDTFHTFSFGDYYDPAHTQFRALRVMNEDTVAPGQGFGMHGHRDMEIVTCVLSGALEHRDSLGNGEVLRPGELQRMTAGTGIRHSEFNPSATEPVHLYQIWLLPERTGLSPELRAKVLCRIDAAGPVAVGGVARCGRWLAAHPSGCAALSGAARSGAKADPRDSGRAARVAASSARKRACRRRRRLRPVTAWQSVTSGSFLSPGTRPAKCCCST